MLMLKECPRCKGDVFVDKDQFGWFEQCLQCGYMLDLATIVREGQSAQKEKDNQLVTAGCANYRFETQTCYGAAQSQT